MIISFPKRGTTTQNTAHSADDLDTPIHTGTQLEKSSPSPKSTKIRMNYNQQYKIVHSYTSDLHQHSVNSEWCCNSAHTTKRTTTAHQSRTHKNLAQIQHIKQNEELNMTIWLHTQFPELLMMREWHLKHVEFYHQINSIKSCSSLVLIWSL